MNIEEDGPLTTAREHEIDFIILQLLETAPDFRDWFLQEVAPTRSIETYLGGITHASYAGEGESDIEFGVRTRAGDRHVVLIENKIQAAKQPDHLERYYNRGRYRVDHEDWDSFTVVLMAPDRYVSTADEEQVDAIVQYEAVLEFLEELTHDSAEFFRTVIDAARRTATTPTEDASDVLRQVKERLNQHTELHDLRQSISYKKRIAFRARHPEHPDAVQYDVYIAETGADGRSNVRLQITSNEALTDAEREAIESTVAQHRDTAPDYEWYPGREKNVLTKTIHHREAVQDPATDAYIDAIADELRTLVETWHPIFVDVEYEAER